MVQSTQGSVSLPGVGQSTQQTYTAATGDGVASRQLNDGGHDFSEGLLDLHHHSSTRQLLGPVNTQSTQQSVAPSCQHTVNTTLSCSIMSTRRQHNSQFLRQVNTTQLLHHVNTQSTQHSLLLHHVKTQSAQQSVAPSCQHAVNTTVSCSVMSTHSQHNSCTIISTCSQHNSQLLRHINTQSTQVSCSVMSTCSQHNSQMLCHVNTQSTQQSVAPSYQHAVNTTVSCSIMSTRSQHNSQLFYHVNTQSTQHSQLLRQHTVNTIVSCSVNIRSTQYSQLLHECFPGANAG